MSFAGAVRSGIGPSAVFVSTLNQMLATHRQRWRVGKSWGMIGWSKYLDRQQVDMIRLFVAEHLQQ